MDTGVETKVYFADGTEKVINVKTVVAPTASGFDQEDYDKDNVVKATKLRRRLLWSLMLRIRLT